MIGRKSSLNHSKNCYLEHCFEIRARRRRVLEINFSELLDKPIKKNLITPTSLKSQ
jgi:hypothetical protein